MDLTDGLNMEDDFHESPNVVQNLLFGDALFIVRLNSGVPSELTTSNSTEYPPLPSTTGTSARSDESRAFNSDPPQTSEQASSEVSHCLKKVPLK